MHCKIVSCENAIASTFFYQVMVIIFKVKKNSFLASGMAIGEDSMYKSFQFSVVK